VGGFVSEVADPVVRVVAEISVAFKPVNVGALHGPEFVLGEVAARGDVVGHNGRGKPRVGFDDHGRDDAKCAGTTAAYRPEKVSVGLGVGRDESPVGCHDLDGQDLVGSQAIDRCQG